MAMHGLQQGINCPTRNKTCLDYFMAKTKATPITFVFNELTDHCPILLRIEYTEKVINKPASIFKTKVNMDGVIKLISEESWNDLYSRVEVNEVAEQLTRKLENAIKLNTIKYTIPKRKIPLRPWMTIGVVKSIRKRDNIHKQIRKNKDNEELKNKYILYRNTLKTVIKMLKKQYYKQKLELNRGNISKTWEIIKDVCNMNNKKVSSSELLIIRSSPIDSLNYVNKFFTSVGSQMARQILDKLNTDDTSLSKKASSYNTPLRSMTFYLTSPDQVISTICSLKQNKAPGIDKRVD